jgi:ferredoxin
MIIENERNETEREMNGKKLEKGKNSLQLQFSLFNTLPYLTSCSCAVCRVDCLSVCPFSVVTMISLSLAGL